MKLKHDRGGKYTFKSGQYQKNNTDYSKVYTTAV